MRKLSFAEWMAAVDAAVESIAGLSIYDLEDQPFADWYEARKSPKAAARAALRASGALGEPGEFADW